MEKTYEYLLTAYFEAVNVEIDDQGVHFGILILRSKAPMILPIVDGVEIELTPELTNKPDMKIILETGFNRHFR